MSEASKPAASVCPNCGTVRSGAFCHRCGQNDKDYLRAVHRVASEMLREAFDLDSRLLRTLWALLARPGRLTREFTQGRRASYMSPVRLYLITSLLFFFLLSISGGWNVTLDSEAKEGLAEAWEEFRSEPDFLKVYGGMDAAQKARIQERFQVPDEEMAALEERATAARQGIDAPEESWDLRLTRKAMASDPADLRDTIVDGMPVAMFFLLPAFALLMKLFYPRRFYTEHLVVGFHLHSFLFLLFAVLLLVPDPAEDTTDALDVFWSWLESLVLIGGLVYGFLTVKGVYGQSALITTLKFFLLFNAYVILLSVAIVSAVVLSLSFEFSF